MSKLTHAVISSIEEIQAESERLDQETNRLVATNKPSQAIAEMVAARRNRIEGLGVALSIINRNLKGVV